MRFTLTVDCGNLAFDEDPEELARILRQAAKSIPEPGDVKSLYDANGNNVGRMKLEKVLRPKHLASV